MKNHKKTYFDELKFIFSVYLDITNYFQLFFDLTKFSFWIIYNF